MRRLVVWTTLLACGLGLNLVSRTLAHVDPGGQYSVYPRVDATVMALKPQGLATSRTSTGSTYEVVQRPSWQVGDQVTCEHMPYARVPWERLDCRKVSGAGG